MQGEETFSMTTMLILAVKYCLMTYFKKSLFGVVLAKFHHNKYTKKVLKEQENEDKQSRFIWSRMFTF